MSSPIRGSDRAHKSPTENNTDFISELDIQSKHLTRPIIAISGLAFAITGILEVFGKLPQWGLSVAATATACFVFFASIRSFENLRAQSEKLEKKLKDDLTTERNAGVALKNALDKIITDLEVEKDRYEDEVLELSKLNDRHKRFERAIDILLRKNRTLRLSLCEKNLLGAGDHPDYEKLKQAIADVLDQLGTGLNMLFDQTTFRCSVWTVSNPNLWDKEGCLRAVRKAPDSVWSETLFPIWASRTKVPASRLKESSTCSIARSVLKRDSQLAFSELNDLRQCHPETFGNEEIGRLRDHGISSGISVPIVIDEQQAGILLVESQEVVEIPDYLEPFVECTANCIATLFQGWGIAEEAFVSGDNEPPPKSSKKTTRNRKTT